MEIIAAPSRQLLTWSMWLLIADGLFNLASVAVNTLSESTLIGHDTSVIINTVFVFLIGAVRFIKQTIPVTEDQKVDMVKSAAALPMKTGEDNVTVQIGGDKAVRSTPK